MTPFGNRVVIKPIEVAPDSFVQPDQLKERPQRGLVKAVGKDVKIIKPGDIVLFSRYAEKEIEIDGESLVLVRENDSEIFAIL